MSSRDELPAEREEVPAPAFVFQGARCALEMALVGMLVLLVGLPANNPVYLGFILLLALVSMVVVLFWGLNQQMAEWVRRAQGKPTIRDDSGLF